VATTPRGPGIGPRSTGRGSAPRPSAVRGAEGPFTSRRAPGTRRSGAGLSIDQRGLRNRWGLILMITLLVTVVGRLAVLQGVDGAAYANAAEQDRLRT
jgi:cell division protein FtsI (penicillin-binding protein 3)